MARKILMVGLGGTGCQVVNRVRRRVFREGVENENRCFSRIAFAGFDTDKREAGKEGLPLVTLSRDVTVGELLKEHPEYEEWFPAEDPFLNARTMGRPSAAVRALGRLALEDALNRADSDDRPFRALDEAFETLRDNDKESSLVVIVISSLAGGMGSGIFIQAALLLRKLIREKFGDYTADTALFRGLFILPDVFMPMMTGVDGASRVEAFSADAYASLKELCAMNRICFAYDAGEQGIQMAYGKLFDPRESGNIMPYASVCLIGALNSLAQALPSFSAYERLAADIAYMQVYSPMANDLESEEDNRIRSTIVGSGRNIYGSCGASRIVYPRGDVVNYCVKRLMADNISETWLYFDDVFRSQLLAARDLRRRDPGTELPKRSEVYIAAVRSTMRNASYQFPFLKDDISIESGSQLVERQDIYLADVKNYLYRKVDGEYAENEVIRTAAAQASKEYCLNKTRHDIIRNINSMQESLKNYYEKVRDQVENIWHGCLLKVVPLKDSDPAGRAPLSLFSLLHRVNDPECAVNPIAARYMLYNLSKSLEKEIDTLTASVSAVSEEIRGLLDRDDWDGNPENGRQTIEQGVKLFNKKGYFSAYTYEYQRCGDCITQYAIESLTLNVLRGLKDHVDRLSKRFEDAFDVMRDIADECGKAVKALEYKNNANTDTDIYVLGDGKAMQRAYARLAVSKPNQDAALNDAMLKLVITAVDQDEKKESPGCGLSKEEAKREESGRLRAFAGNIRRLFDKDITAMYCGIVESDTSDAVNISVFQALDRHIEKRMEEEGLKDKAEARKAFLKEARSRAMPMLIYDTDAAQYLDHTVFWGVNSEAAEDMSPAELNDFFDGNDPEKNGAYSPYEICCYRAVYSLRPENIPAFRDTSEKMGPYCRSYDSLRARLLTDGADAGRAITPHTDKRWISADYLPMISDERSAQDRRNAAEALLLGTRYGCLIELDIHGKTPLMVAVYERGGRECIQRLMTVDGPVRGGDCLNAFRALRDNPALAESLLAFLYRIRSAETEADEETDDNPPDLKTVCESLLKDARLAALEDKTKVFSDALARLG